MTHLVRIRLLAFAALVALAIVPSVAAAAEHENEPAESDEAPRFGAVVDAAYDEALQVLIFAINAVDAEVAVDCALPEGVELERAEDEVSGDVTVTVTDGDWELPEGCTVVDVVGPAGQVNHGQVVSSFVHALKALDRNMIDVPFGQLVRQIAGSDLGKAENPADDGEDTDDGEGHGPPPHANNDKDKKPKSNGSNNGNGRGPNK